MTKRMAFRVLLAVGVLLATTLISQVASAAQYGPIVTGIQQVRYVK